MKMHPNIRASLLLAVIAGAPALAQNPTSSSSTADTRQSAFTQASAQTSGDPKQSHLSSKTQQTTVAPKSAGPPSHYLPSRFAGRAGQFYRHVWGIDSLTVKLMESGELVRFTYRVVDTDRASLLNDKKLAPSLIDPQASVSLVVPSMEKIGQLRQSATPELGKSYWIAFSNKGRPVKRGDRVNVVIGTFKAEGLMVD
jgi:hypothetical protein